MTDDRRSSPPLLTAFGQRSTDRVRLQADETLIVADAELDRAERLLGVAVVAKRFGVCVQTVRNWIRTGRLDAQRTLAARGHFQIPASAVDALQKAQRAQKTQRLVRN